MRTNQFVPTPQQWQQYRRLSAAGCPIDWNSLAEPCFPLRVRQQAAALGTELLPLPGGTMMVCRLSILASVRFRLKGIRLQANWLPSSLGWPNYCSCHAKHCFHDCCGGDVRLAPGGLLTKLYWGPLKRGDEVSGYLAYILRGVVPPSAGRKLEASLLLTDELDRHYPYGLVLENSQRITGDGDAYCCFYSKNEIQTEIEQREAEKRIAEQRALALASRATKGSSLAAIIDRFIESEVSGN